jgi:hypothetical protein
MELVQDDLGIGTVLATFHLKGGRHVHGHRRDLVAPPLAEPFEEGLVGSSGLLSSWFLSHSRMPEVHCCRPLPMDSA